MFSVLLTASAVHCNHNWLYDWFYWRNQLNSHKSVSEFNKNSTYVLDTFRSIHVIKMRQNSVFMIQTNKQTKNLPPIKVIHEIIVKLWLCCVQIISYNFIKIEMFFIAHSASCANEWMCVDSINSLMGHMQCDTWWWKSSNSNLRLKLKFAVELKPQSGHLQR